MLSLGRLTEYRRSSRPGGNKHKTFKSLTFAMESWRIHATEPGPDLPASVCTIIELGQQSAKRTNDSTLTIGGFCSCRCSCALGAIRRCLRPGFQALQPRKTFVRPFSAGRPSTTTRCSKGSHSTTSTAGCSSPSVGMALLLVRATSASRSWTSPASRWATCT